MDETQKCRAIIKIFENVRDVRGIDRLKSLGVDEFFYFGRFSIRNGYSFANYMKGIDPLTVYEFIKSEYKDYLSKPEIEYIPYSQV